MHLAGVLDAIHNSHKTVQNAFIGFRVLCYKSGRIS